ncbi:MAG TPA: DNA-binding domain-containing protein [Patescibacteria group bacterium]|nr:DNA-binding domain-containing protein [Patescibacteria group bacterium]
MNLALIQRKMARAVMAPLAPGYRMRQQAPGGGSMRRYAGSFIKPNDRLTSFERLEIYNRQYWFRVLTCLADDFPGLRALLGEKRFDRLSEAYLAECPSRSFTLRNLGSRLPGWIEKHPRFVRPHARAALDMARLEWAQVVAFDGPRDTPLQPQDLAEAFDPRMRLRLQPYITLLVLQYPVDDLVLEVNRDSEDAEAASNAFTGRRTRASVRRFRRLKPQPIFLAVHRNDDSVYFRRLEPEAFSLLAALRDGKSITGAIARAFRGSAMPPAERAETVREWFELWSALGWFCRPAARAPSV